MTLMLVIVFCSYFNSQTYVHAQYGRKEGTQTWAQIAAPPLGWGFSGGSVGKESACNTGNTGDTGSIPGLGRSPGEGHGYPLQYSCLENPMNRGAWQVTVQRVAELDTTEVSEHIPPGYLLALASGLITVNLNLISF